MKVLITGLVTILIIGLLAWTHFHGGVPSHHILDQKDLPEISNWWSGLLLPVLTWFLLGRIEKRIGKQELQTQQIENPYPRTLGLFLIGLAFAILLATSFTFEYKPFLDSVLYIILGLSLIIPIYYSEFILGFIIGMTFTFGAILPTAFILILAAFGFLIYRFIRPQILKIAKRLRS